MTTAADFLTALWGADATGALADAHMIAEKTDRGFRHYHAHTVGDAVVRALEISSRKRDAYLACGAFKTYTEGAKGNRAKTNALGANAFWLDLDCGQGKPYADQKIALDALKSFCQGAPLPLPSILVNSGHGLHVYWHFEKTISRGDWEAHAAKMKALTDAKGLHADPTRTADIASVLRLPETYNWKDSAAPKLVECWALRKALDLQSFVSALDAASALLAPSNSATGSPTAVLGSNITPAGSNGGYPPSSALKIAAACPTLAYVESVKGKVSEPLWRAMLGLVKHTTEGGALGHNWSKGDPRYAHTETEKKLNDWTAGPATCAAFRNCADNQCAGCPQTCKSPIVLGYPQDASKLKMALAEMDLRYFVVRIKGSTFVCDDEDADILQDAMTFTAFTQFHATKRVEGKPIAAVWLNSPARRTFQSLTFDPSGETRADEFNTWRGLAVKPRKGRSQKIREHIRDVWCGGDAAQFGYTIRWLASLVQRPWEKPGVALVLRSKEGTGKTIITDVLLKIFGQHGFTAAQKDQVLGKFNGHLFDKVLVVLEEAFFAGDHSAVAGAKVLVTNATMGYEAKGKASLSASNYAHVIMLTNNQWAVPAGEDTRRWMVLDVSDARRGDHGYFTDLASCIRDGGTEAFLHRLLHVDLTGWNPRSLPDSKALVAQQVETMRRTDPVTAWWMSALAEGEFPIEGGGVPWNAEITASDLDESYSKATRGARHAPPFNVAMQAVRKLLPQGSLGKVRKSRSGDRFQAYMLPDLAVARAHFKAEKGVDPCAS